MSTSLDSCLGELQRQRDVAVRAWRMLVTQYAALHGPKRRVIRVLHISRADARRQRYKGPRFKLVLECGHEVRRALVRAAASVKCGECLGPGFNTKGFRE